MLNKVELLEDDFGRSVMIDGRMADVYHRWSTSSIVLSLLSVPSTARTRADALAEAVTAAMRSGNRYCPIPGSYAIEVVARCQIGKTLREEFALLHMRRYQTDELSAALRSVGWATVARLVIEGNPKEATDALMLFQRMRK